MNENKTQPIRVAIYLRVSTEEQAKEGYGIRYQEERLRAFVKSQDYVLNERHIYNDEGYSGSLEIEHRPELKRLFEDAKKKEFDMVLVYKLDRFFRRIILLLTAVEELVGYGIGFKSANEPFDTSTHYGRYMMASMGALAELEREVIKERMMAGRRSAAKTGKWVMGLPPYGYKVNKQNGHLELDGEEAKVVRNMFEWSVYERLSTHKICKRLNNLKVLTRFGRYPNIRRKTAEIWYKRTIGRILTNETYAGVAYYQKYKRKKGGINEITDAENLKDPNGWIAIPVPAIISRELFEMTKQRLVKNKEMSERNQKTTYLFSKVLYCGYCGLRLTGYTSPNKYGGCKEYRGGRNQKSDNNPLSNSNRCKSCGYHAESRIMPVWDTLKDLLKNPTYIMKHLENYASNGKKAEDVQKKIDRVDREVEGVEKKRGKLVNLYLEDGVMEYSVYKQRLGEIEQELNMLKLERVNYSQLVTSQSDKKEVVGVLKNTYNKLKSRLDNASYETKREVITLLVNKIVLFGRKNEANLFVNMPQFATNTPSNLALRGESRRHANALAQSFL